MLAATEQTQDTRTLAPRPRRVAAAAVQPSAPHTPLSIVQAALASGNVEMYREAVTLMKEMDAFTAQKAFNNALSEAKAELPIILKNSHVSFENARGDQTSYWHEDLAQVVDTVVPILSRHGLSHRWRLRGKPGEPVTVTCVLSHRDGYFEENEISAAADTSGGKNPIQGTKSAISYLERITLMASLGLASRRDDDDGRGTDQSTAPPAIEVEAKPGCITQRQADDIREALEDRGINRAAFLQWARQKRIEDIPAAQYESCLAGIEKYRRGTRQ